MSSKASIRTKTYSKFRGVDFSSDPSLVDDFRSPWAPNMISDAGGMPEKRPGWRIIIEGNGIRVNGLYSVEFGGVRHLLCHRGTKLLRWYEETKNTTELRTGLPDERSMAVYMGGYLWIFTGAELLRYNGLDVERASVGAYVPMTVISASPTDGGGMAYEGVNYLTGKQKIGYVADGNTDYKLPYTELDSVDFITVNGEELSKDKYAVDLAKGTVKFTEAPPKPLAGAADNVVITLTKTVPGAADKINKCRIATVWGVGGASDRIIASGNSDYPNFDFTCAFNDGTYWSDTDYQVVGTAQTKIMGYRRLGENLAIIKEDNGQDSTVFIRSSGLDEYGGAVWSTKPCLSGAGAVSRFGFGNIDDEQLFITGSGIYALTTNSLTSERIVQNRSARIDPKLIKENLADAVSISFDGAYMVFIDDRVYGLDGKQQRSYPSRADTSYLYECFYWDNVPARVVMKLVENGKEYLYFGTKDGRICKLNTDIDGLTKFNDGGAPIRAVWSTKADDDGDPMILKTLLKKGNAVTIKPYNRSSAKICFRTDKDAEAQQVAYGTMDIFDWEDIDFERFTFNSNDAPSEIPFNRKVKNYKRLQFVVVNDVANEGFGVYGITKHFVTGNFAKT
ncbi:MAG: hypothetical protein IJP16_04945 [Clostridia bacterium]|nr:hypothetical protein [Clostridia bacterium]